MGTRILSQAKSPPSALTELLKHEIMVELVVRTSEFLFAPDIS